MLSEGSPPAPSLQEVAFGGLQSHTLCFVTAFMGAGKQTQWFGVWRDLKDHLVATPLPRAGTHPTTPDCSQYHPTWLRTLPGMSGWVDTTSRV